MILFHITKRKHLSNIITIGLIPAKRRGMKLPGEKCKSVFLTNDVNYINDTNYIINNQHGSKWLKKNDCIVLHIDTKGLKIEPHRYSDGMTYTLSDKEFVTDYISPKHIIKISELN